MRSVVSPLSDARRACSSCRFHELSLPLDCSEREERQNALVSARRYVRRGEPLFLTGQPFRAIHAIRTGFFKSCVVSESGREQVTGFAMAGELIGLDGLANGVHTCDVIALEDSQVCIVPYAELMAAMHDSAALQTQFHRLLSREIVRGQSVMLQLGSMHAEERVAAFLVELVERLQARGLSGASLVLRMTRQEIGSYLGLKLETVSRCFSHFKEVGILDVRHRNIQVRDPAALRALVTTPLTDDYRAKA